MFRTFVVWNPRSGRAMEAAEICQHFRARAGTDVHETSSAEEARKVTKQACDDGFKVIVAAGGDGTVNSVANGLAGRPNGTTMAVLPIGTANDFAATLAIPDDFAGSG